MRVRVISRAAIIALLLFVLLRDGRITRPQLLSNQRDNALSAVGGDEFGLGVITANDIPVATPTNDPKLPNSESPFGVDPILLQRVLDQTSAIPLRPYFHLVDIVNRHTADELMSNAVGEDRVTYANLWNQPELHRGKLIHLRGTLRGATRFELTSKAGDAPQGIDHLYQADLLTDASRPRPYVLIVPALPKDMPQGREISENVEFVGFFLKQWRYRSAGNVDRAAPLFIGRIVSWTPSVQNVPHSPMARMVIGGVLVMGVIVMSIVAWRLSRSETRITKPEVHEETLASLGRLENSDQQ